LLVAEHATGLNRGCAAALGESTAGSNAGVSSLELDDDVLCVEDLLQAAQDLLVQALLDLRAATEILDDAVELGKANNLAVGVVADMGHTTEEQEVVLAHRGEGYVALENDRVLSHRESGACWKVVCIQARAKLLHVHLGDTVRSLFNRGVLEVDPHSLEDLFEGAFDLLDLLSLLHWGTSLNEKRILKTMSSEVFTDHLTK